MVTMGNLIGDSANPQVPAVSGKHTTNGRGVAASSAQGIAVEATATKDTAVFAHSDAGRGIDARSGQFIAVEATATKDTAVFAHSDTGIGVDGRSKTHTGVWGSSEQGIGVRGEGGQYAGYFEGNVYVTGDVTLPGADCAEDFEAMAVEEIDPGTVMVINFHGALCQSTEAYDRRVAGVVSGAGQFKPGLVLGRQAGKANRLPIALTGRVYCKVDADFGSIKIGDLLTPSNTPGHAMRATDPAKAFGAVIGKAMQALESGRGLIPILVALQ